jgi:hypothetical protein
MRGCSYSQALAGLFKRLEEFVDRWTLVLAQRERVDR